MWDAKNKIKIAHTQRQSHDTKNNVVWQFAYIHGVVVLHYVQGNYTKWGSTIKKSPKPSLHGLSLKNLPLINSNTSILGWVD